jgi:phenylalanyl-tRNA synthetase beta chain
VGEIVEVSKVPGKDKLSKMSVNVGDIDPLQIVTSAPNVKLGARIAIATVGTAVGDQDNGEVVRKTAVGGVQSYGMVCDGPMLGWGPSNKGLAALLPTSCAIGSVPPDRKPRGDL